MRKTKHAFKLVSRNENGFSLIEAMVAIVIFAIGILGAYKLQIHATAGNALANRVSTSANWAAYVAEELISRGYDHPDFDDDNGNGGMSDIDPPVMDEDADGILHLLADGSSSSDSLPPAGSIYSVYWNIAVGDTSTDGILNDVKLIQVNVVRNGGIGNGHLYTHNYYKAKWPETE